MGLLVDGKWQDAWYATKPSGGRFIRKDSSFRNWITADGSPGPADGIGVAASYGRVAAPSASAWRHAIRQPPYRWPMRCSRSAGCGSTPCR